VSAFGRAATWLGHELAAEVTAPYVQRGARIFSDAATAAGGARDAYVYTRAMRHDGLRGSRMVSAGEWFHGLSDRQNAIAQLGADFSALQGDLALHATSPADVAWTVSVVAPVMAAWQDFAQKQHASGLSPWVTEWSVYLTWQERLHLLRSLARSRGIELDSPDPVPLPLTVWERSRTGEGGGLDAWLGLFKVVLLGAAATAGLVGFVAIAREWHRGLSR